MDHQNTAPYHGAMEAPPEPVWSTLPEVVYTSGLEVPGDAAASGPVGDPQQKAEYSYIYTDETPAAANPTPLFWKRYKLWIIIWAVAAVVIIAIVVGTTVGLLVKKSDSSSKNDNGNGNGDGKGSGNGDGGGDDKDSPQPSATTDLFGTPTTFPKTTRPPSACRGTVCPTTLTAAQYAADDSFFLFGLGGDGAIWSRHANGSQWVGDWESQGGSFASQPDALSTDDGHVDLFAVGKDGAMRTRAFRDGAWADNWVNLGGDATSPPTVCSGASGRIDVFAVAADGHNLMHKWYVSDTWHPSESGEWEIIKGFISGSPVATTGGDNRIDVTAYGGEEDPFDVMFNHYNSSGMWSGWEAKGGNFRGDPGAIALGSDQTILFGIGTRKDMYSITYDVDSGYSRMIGLGGGIESLPVVLATGTDRIDVLGIGTDDALWHKARIGSTWAVDWELLGGYFNGAPAVVTQGDSIVNVFGVGPGGKVIHGNWTVVTGNNEWGEGSWFVDGGSIANKWLRGGPA